MARREKILRAIRYPSIIKNRLLRKLGDWKIDYHLGKGKAFPPYTVFMAPTFRCNLKCIMCSIKDMVHDKNLPAEVKRLYSELSWEDMKKVVDNFCQIKPNVYLGGGDPMDYPHILDLLEYVLYHHHCFIGMTTNGTYFNQDVAKEIVRLKVPYIHISFDGIHEVFDSVRGKGVFERALRGFDNIIEQKKVQKSEFPELSIVYTITTTNYHNLVDTWNFFVERGVKNFLIQHLAFFPPDLLRANNEKYDDPLFHVGWEYGGAQIEADKIDINMEVFIEQIEKLKQLHKQTKGSTLKFIPELSPELLRIYYSDQPMPVTKDDLCLVPWKFTVVYPSGDVMVTSFCFFQTMGNLLKQDFMEIWNGEKYQKVRRFLKKEKWMPVCTKCKGIYGGCT